MSTTSVARTVISLAVVTASATATWTIAHAPFLASEIAQLIDHMEHGITVHGIVFRIATPVGCQMTGEIALLTEDVIKLESDYQATTREQLLRDLRIPYHLCGVESGVAVASSHTLIDIGVESHVPRQPDIKRASVGVMPRISVGITLQLVATAGQLHVCISLHLKP